MRILKRYRIREGSIAWWVARLLPIIVALLVLGWLGHRDLTDYCRMHNIPLPR